MSYFKKVPTESFSLKHRFKSSKEFNLFLDDLVRFLDELQNNTDYSMKYIFDKLGTSPVADGTYNIDGSAAGTVATITTRNGIITAITTR